MIKKIIKIKGVGKFFDFAMKASPKWNGEFKPITLIYGENGIGKTTFTSILKSLKNNDTLVYQLRSFGRDDSPEISIKLDNERLPIKYKDGEWDKNIENIEIFDTHFINENIFTGFEILPQHRKNLFEIVIGDEGVKLKYQIAEIKTEIKNNSKILKDIEKSIYRHINIFGLNEILTLQYDSKIDEKITVKQKEIDASKANKKIQISPYLKEVSIIDYEIRYENLKKFCEKSIDTISQEYLEIVDNHKNELNLKNRSEQWIKDGVDNIIDEKCPFCLQNIETAKIIEAYNHYFNEQYLNLQKHTKSLQEKATTLNPEHLFSEIEKDYNFNKGYIGFWGNYVNTDILDLEIETFKIQTIELTKRLKELISEKSSNPIKSVKIEIINALEKTLYDGNLIIEKYNIFVELYNEKIKSLKNHNKKDLNILETDLEKLKAVKTRQIDKVKELCINYQKKDKQLQKLKTQNSTTQTKLKQYTFQIFGSYKKQINIYLQKFAPYLEIKEMKSTYRGGGTEPFAEYGLYVSGNKIKFRDDFNNPSVKYSLSEGDKSALALSFFLAKINADDKINDKIIIFDDPISSFDINRKISTISQLFQISQKANQLIVLTHNLLFARDFWEKVKNQVQTIKLSFIRNTTQMIDYDIEHETLNGLFKDYNLLDNYLQIGVSSDTEKRNVARSIRPIIEGYFRIKFYGIFTSNEWLGDFLKKVYNSETNSALHKLKTYYTDLDEINDFSKKFHHTNPNSDSEPIYDAELENYVKKTFDIIAKI